MWGKSALLVGMLAILQPLIADEVLLRDGSRLEGLIVGQDASSILLQTNGKSVRLLKSDIRSMTYDAATKETRRKEEERRKELERKKAIGLQEAERDKEKKRREAELRARRDSEAFSSALLRSAIAPGWGQLYKGEVGKAGLFFLGFAGFGMLHMQNRARARTLSLEYGDTFLPAAAVVYFRGAGVAPAGAATLLTLRFDSLAEKRAVAVARANRSLAAFGLLHAFNLTDILLSGRVAVAGARPGNPAGRDSARLALLPVFERRSVQILFVASFRIGQ